MISESNGPNYLAATYPLTYYGNSKGVGSLLWHRTHLSSVIAL